VDLSFKVVLSRLDLNKFHDVGLLSCMQAGTDTYQGPDSSDGD
jgi:hypothetical protein